ncbi:LysM peptidoglycan-binding domain-containing protein [Oceanobacillus piezotolerans]|uniref:LysM peptidoglycan-binding domain-containing protein n=1 Tax=Oceanobacillus piezotolerans TaxID=2448030 RepID=A0A498D711_9BACI|nr:3D domain-containing protein [Oceanobacillus piezotolerans]RLL45449.1 LysM peptidoglycan-binding domain-containing protein [Oceanobacillus piezotolerans]
MKKLVTLIVGFIVIGVSATTVSAAADYEVKKGDSLWAIARNNNTSVEVLMDINDMHSTTIYPKQVLKITKEEAVETAEAAYYKVQPGDTLSEISKKYGGNVTVSNLMAWNNLASDFIVVGQQLTVNGATPVENTAELETQSVEATENEEVHTSEESVAVTEEKVEEVEEVEEAKETVAQDSEPEGRTIAVESTAYTAHCAGCSGVTATGIDLRANPNMKLIAVDPNVIPLGSKVYVEGYGYAVAGDTGGAIRGNKIDVHVPTKDEAYQWGRRTVNVTIVD